MNTIAAVSFDLSAPAKAQRIYVKQNDDGTRAVDISLFSGGNPWLPPAGAAISLCYHKPDGTSGNYDTLPDGSRAYQIQEHHIIFHLAPQLMSCPGQVSCELIIAAGGQRISSFVWYCMVEASVESSLASEDYFRLSTIEGLRQELLQEISNAKQELNANPGMYQDVTQQYLDACESNRDLLGEDFLQALPEGQYCILLPYAKYLARNVNSGDIPYSDTIYYEDDGFIYQYRYMYHQLVETWESFLSDSDTGLFCSVKAIAETAAQFPALQREVTAINTALKDAEHQLAELEDRISKLEGARSGAVLAQN